MPTELNLPDIERGDTVPFTMNFHDGIEALDMRGKTLVMSFKFNANQADSDASLIKTVLHPIDAPDELKGQISFKLERSETAMLVPGATYNYAVRIITPGEPEDDELTYFSGAVNVKDS